MPEGQLSGLQKEVHELRGQLERQCEAQAELYGDVRAAHEARVRTEQASAEAVRQAEAEATDLRLQVWGPAPTTASDLSEHMIHALYVHISLFGSTATTPQCVGAVTECSSFRWHAETVHLVMGRCVSAPLDGSHTVPGDDVAAARCPGSTTRLSGPVPNAAKAVQCAGPRIAEAVARCMLTRVQVAQLTARQEASQVMVAAVQQASAAAAGALQEVRSQHRAELKRLAASNGSAVSAAAREAAALEARKGSERCLQLEAQLGSAAQRTSALEQELQVRPRTWPLCGRCACRARRMRQGCCVHGGHGLCFSACARCCAFQPAEAGTGRGSCVPGVHGWRQSPNHGRWVSAARAE